MKAEYYLPFAVDALIKDGKATAKVLTTDSRWYGVTYREDKPTICAAVAAMTEKRRLSRRSVKSEAVYGLFY